MEIDEMNEQRLDELEKKVKKFEEDEKFVGLRIWTIGDSYAYDISISMKKQKAEINRLMVAINRHQTLFPINDFIFVVDKIVCVKRCR